MPAEIEMTIPVVPCGMVRPAMMGSFRPDQVTGRARPESAKGRYARLGGIFKRGRDEKRPARRRAEVAHGGAGSGGRGEAHHEVERALVDVGAGVVEVGALAIGQDGID